MSSNKPPVVACPQCGKEHIWDTSNRYRPFCSERCKMIDLGKWANEEYRVAQPEQPYIDDETDSPSSKN